MTTPNESRTLPVAASPISVRLAALRFSLSSTRNEVAPELLSVLAEIEQQADDFEHSHAALVRDLSDCEIELRLCSELLTAYASGHVANHADTFRRIGVASTCIANALAALAQAKGEA